YDPAPRADHELVAQAAPPVEAPATDLAPVAKIVAAEPITEFELAPAPVPADEYTPEPTLAPRRMFIPEPMVPPRPRSAAPPPMAAKAEPVVETPVAHGAETVAPPSSDPYEEPVFEFALSPALMTEPTALVAARSDAVDETPDASEIDEPADHELVIDLSRDITEISPG